VNTAEGEVIMKYEPKCA